VLSPEVSDLVVSYDPKTLERRPVHKREVCELFASYGNWRARAIVESLPDTDGVLDAEHVDALLLRVHCELQRLSEEFQQGLRVQRVLKPLLAALRESGVPLPLRVVDVGCGLAYVLRWLALRGELGADVELVGADLNRSLVEAAERAARAEGARCRFVVADAFGLELSPAIFMSTGVIHHFRDQELVAFFRAQSHARALLHFDIKPTWLSPIGAWIFHRARMREALSRHDGVHSALRAHSGETLLGAARAASPEFRFALLDSQPSLFPILRVLHAVVGVRADSWARFEAALGPLAARLGPSEAGS
jgi:SAM-dependent methyltransferase